MTMDESTSGIVAFLQTGNGIREMKGSAPELSNLPHHNNNTLLLAAGKKAAIAQCKVRQSCCTSEGCQYRVKKGVSDGQGPRIAARSPMCGNSSFPKCGPTTVLVNKSQCLWFRGRRGVQHIFDQPKYVSPRPRRAHVLLCSRPQAMNSSAGSLCCAFGGDTLAYEPAGPLFAIHEAGNWH